MTIDSLVEELLAIRKIHGNLTVEVYVGYDDCEATHAIVRESHSDRWVTLTDE